jgi:hypothetical protein
MQEKLEMFEKKYNEKRIALKDLEKITSSHITMLEREKAVIEEKMINIEKRAAEEVRQKDKELNEAKDQLAQSGYRTNENIMVLESEINTQKLRISELERKESDYLA